MKSKLLVVIFAGLVLASGTSLLFKQSMSSDGPANHSGVAHAQSNTGDIKDLTGRQEVLITIKDFSYGDTIKISKGTTVTWVNEDDTEHNVLADHDHDDIAHDAPQKHETHADELGSPLLARGESYSFKFKKSGSVGYHCSPHPDMRGKIIVE